MNENIDLTELYSPLYGKVIFSEIGEKGSFISFTKEGYHYNTYSDAECVLFPSKKQRDWPKFTAPWYKKEKFDPNTLQPFDKVLVRDGVGYKWNADFYSYKLVGRGHSFIDNTYLYCIPYNDDTKHLLGTTDEAPEYYRYWEE